ncbi:unnamed protein product [Cylicostephanus goldi]|uniref:Uncharacterized protein n=1 Tax=Cylicostephanus goldi TaxID=71465 RepID=A0A3P7MBX5_CYLGO|nr:unnamed protein product [Cylicostephanus goldi]
MFTGDVHWINMESGAEESHTLCHSSGITSIVPSQVCFVFSSYI